ncbi:CFEM domain-containing protein [Ceratocystis lukuohia]|uniref:CFEM domain-containing protein n=1 Tax=Ceratocystis lukuohia TaxID=2019550 RepID=A0ABR4MRB3_9PEZI
MKFTLALLPLAAIATAVNLDVTDYFPSCSLNCLGQAVSNSSSCSLSDSVCMCTNAIDEDLALNANSCMIKDCGSTVAFTDVMSAADKFCRAALSGTTATGGVASLLGTATGTNAASATGTSNGTATAGGAANIAPAIMAIVAAGMAAL